MRTKSWVRNLVLFVGVGFGTLFFYQNCAPNGGFSPVGKQYALPYSKARVQFRTAYPPEEDRILSVERPIAKGTPISVLIDNSCAEASCSPIDTQSVSCALWNQHKHPKLVASHQFYSSRMPTDMSVAEIDAWISQSPADQQCIVGISELQTYNHTVFNDTLYADQAPYLKLVNFDLGLSQLDLASLAPVKVAVIDTGVEASPDLIVADRTDMRDNNSKLDPTCPSGDLEDYYGHGTAVASIISASQGNGKGIAGVAPNAKIYSLMIGRCSDSQAGTAEIGNAVLMAIQYKVDIINISYGGNTGDDIALRQALLLALNSGITVVVAAGNNGIDISPSTDPKKNFYPAHYSIAYPGIISVASVDSTGRLSIFSNFSGRTVKIAAPGERVSVLASSRCGSLCANKVNQPDGTVTTQLNGTSFSAPMVAGAAALAIGFLKANQITYEPGYIDSVVTSLGARTQSGLYNQVKDQKLIDFDKLAKSLKGTLTDTADRTAITAYSSLSVLNGKPQVTISVTWNLKSVHPGARLGIYDGTCEGTAQPCLIRDIALTATAGSTTFILNRNDLVPMIPASNDPTYSLPLNVAIHYPIPKVDSNGKIIGYLNNHGIDAMTSINVRTFSASSPTSELLGRITNIRTDMQYLYVQGWACHQANNAALNVGLVDTNDQPIPSKAHYVYNLMVPDRSPFDSYPNFDNRQIEVVGLDKVRANYLKPFESTKPNFVPQIHLARNVDQNTHLAGMEAIPDNVLICQTLTSAHGFELILSLQKIKIQNLEGKTIRVRAQLGTKTLYVKDPVGRYEFEIPEINYQPTVLSNVVVNRGSKDFVISGTVCSESPSPIEAEINANFSNFYQAILDQKYISEGKSYIDGDWQLVHDPGFKQGYYYQITKLNYFISNHNQTEFGSMDEFLDYMETRSITVSKTSPTVKGPYDSSKANDKILIDLFDQNQPKPFNTEAFPEFGVFPAYVTVRSKFNNGFVRQDAKAALYDVYDRPDLFDQSTRNRIYSLITKLNKEEQREMNSLGFVQFKTGAPIRYHTGMGIEYTLGPQYQKDLDIHRLDRSAVSFVPFKSYWDMYDVGEVFSTQLVGYRFNPNRPVGQYLKNTYNLTRVLRETKKYEVPLSVWQLILGHTQLQRALDTGSCSGKHRHTLTATITDYTKYTPWVYKYVRGWYLAGDIPLEFAIEPPEQTIRRLPLELRLFQDGKLLQHLSSDTGTNFVQKNYPSPLGGG